MYGFFYTLYTTSVLIVCDSRRKRGTDKCDVKWNHTDCRKILQYPLSPRLMQVFYMFPTIWFVQPPNTHSPGPPP